MPFSYSLISLGMLLVRSAITFLPINMALHMYNTEIYATVAVTWGHKRSHKLGCFIDFVVLK